MVILGIDPGTTRIGYGVIKKNGGSLEHLESGLIELTATNHGEKLVALEEKIKAVIRKTGPARIGVEKLYFTKNKKTALAVAEARGVILNTIMKTGIPLFEVGPNEVKFAVTGNGRASKESVAKMVNYFLKIKPKKMVDDVSDALAIAIAVSNKRGG
ncbi:MAG: crossover junction endodeoxyribonuclease RuvC [Candidatus Jorgensenbacteria bacterium]